VTDFVVLYSNSTGFVLGAWVRATSDNITTFVADAKLTVDGVDVIFGLGSRADLAAVVLTDPTDLDVEAPLNSQRVDDATTPTDADERTDGGRTTGYTYDRPPD